MVTVPKPQGWVGGSAGAPWFGVRRAGDPPTRSQNYIGDMCDRVGGVVCPGVVSGAASRLIDGCTLGTKLKLSKYTVSTIIVMLNSVSVQCASLLS